MVQGKILGFETSPKGNIIIDVEYTLPDNTKVINKYHAQYLNFVNKTQLQIEDWVKKQIDFQCERYLEAYARAKINLDIIKNSLDSLKDTICSKEKVAWNITDKGELITDQVDITKITGIILKRILIDEQGKITTEDIV